VDVPLTVAFFILGDLTSLLLLLKLLQYLFISMLFNDFCYRLFLR